MKERVFPVLIVLAISSTLVLAKTWTARPELTADKPNSLGWCISSAASGDTVILAPGDHYGPVSLSKNLVLSGPDPDLVRIIAPYRLFEASHCVITIQGLTLQSLLRHDPDLVARMSDVIAQFNNVRVESGTRAGTALRVEGNSAVTLTACDFRNAPSGFVVQLANCTTNVVTAGCQWPVQNETVFQRLIWDKADDVSLGLVIH
jgi:hypothetical protein